MDKKSKIQDAGFKMNTVFCIQYLAIQFTLIENFVEFSLYKKQQMWYNIIYSESLCSPVAQSVEQVAVNHFVIGSSPVGGAITWYIAKS